MTDDTTKAAGGPGAAADDDARLAEIEARCHRRNHTGRTWDEWALRVAEDEAALIGMLRAEREARRAAEAKVDRLKVKVDDIRKCAEAGVKARASRGHSSDGLDEALNAVRAAFAKVDEDYRGAFRLVCKWLDDAAGKGEVAK